MTRDLGTPCRCCEGLGYSVLHPRVNGRMRSVRIECGACDGTGRIAPGGWEALGQINITGMDGRPLGPVTNHIKRRF